MDTEIGQDNVGYRLMMKMGWKTGMGLGLDGSGRTTPVPISEKRGADTTGIGELPGCFLDMVGAQRRARIS